MPLKLSDIVEKPGMFTSEVVLPSGEKAVFRPLKKNDSQILTIFLENLSKSTREYYTLDSYDLSTAKEMCDAINRYDKLRFIVVSNKTKKIIALFEYSFDIPESDRKRFLEYGVDLNSTADCRIGPCISDEYQNQGVGSALFPLLVSIAQKFNQNRMLLWGGVLANNERAINFYKKNGFKNLGNFKNKDDKESLDMILDLK